MGQRLPHIMDRTTLGAAGLVVGAP